MKLKSIFNSPLGVYVGNRGTFSILQMMVHSFFGIFIYVITDSFEAVFIGFTIFYAAMLVGFLTNAVISHRLSFSESYKLSFVFGFIVYTLVALTFDSVSELLVYVIIGHGLVNGLFFSISNNYALEELRGSLEKTMWVSTGIIQIFGTVTPLMVGLILENNDYSAVFMIAAITSLAAVLLIPMNHQEQHSDSFELSDVIKVVTEKRFAMYAIAMYLRNILMSVIELLMMIVPFILLGESELNVGVLIAASSLISGMMNLVMRNTKETDIVAFLGSLISVLVTIALAVLWSPVALVTRSISAPVFQSMYLPRKLYYIFHNMQHLVPHNSLATEGTEIVLIRESILFLSRTTAALIIILILNISADFAAAARLLLFIGSLDLLINLMVERFVAHKLDPDHPLAS